MYSLGTKSGGGGTCNGLAADLSKRKRTCPLELFLTETCMLNEMNRMMKSLCKKYFRYGRIKNCNYI